MVDDGYGMGVIISADGSYRIHSLHCWYPLVNIQKAIVKMAQSK